jgi:hypothetical protein
MAIIPQRTLFSWQQISELGDLERLELVLQALPDESLMAQLERDRSKGRNDYPIRAVWNSVLAGIVFQHKSIESLRRELARNGQLRWLCGFDLMKGQDAIPGSYVYTRFLRLLLKYADQIEAIFDQMVEQLHRQLPGFGHILALDGKAIPTIARPRKQDDPKTIEPDGRRDLDADHGTKTYKGQRADGTLWEKTKHWFGYKLHLIVDADYELPVGYEITKASKGEQPQGHQLINQLQAKHPRLIEGCQALTADKGLDDTKLHIQLWDELGIKPVIDIRNMWRDGEPTKLIEGQTHVVYDYQGNVSCHCPATGQVRAMAYGGFEKDRQTLKYRCPAQQYGIHCKGKSCCSVGSGSGQVRVELSIDRRIFCPLPRHSHRWKQIYKKRTAVERVNSRIDGALGFERHFIRGLKKMKLRMGLSLMVMLAMALGRIKQQQEDRLRSLVRAA